MYKCTVSFWSWALVKDKATWSSLENYSQIIVKNKQWKGDRRGGKEKQKIDRWFLLSYQSQVSLSFYQGHFSLTQLKGCNFIPPICAACSPLPPLPWSAQGSHTQHLPRLCLSLLQACHCLPPLLLESALSFRTHLKLHLIHEAFPAASLYIHRCFFLNIFSKSFFKKSNRMWWAFVLIISLTLVSASEAQAPFPSLIGLYMHE